MTPQPVHSTLNAPTCNIKDSTSVSSFDGVKHARDEKLASLSSQTPSTKQAQIMLGHEMSSLMDVSAGHMGALSLLDMSIKITALLG